LHIEGGVVRFNRMPPDLDPRAWFEAQLSSGARDAASHSDVDTTDALADLRRLHAGTPVLVAAENPVLREHLRALLESAGLRVAAAATGVEAFSLAMQLNPALVLLDVELPQRGGVAAARAIQAMAPSRPPIIAMMSGCPGLSADQALDAELADVIPKPIPAGLLYNKVLAWLSTQ
jgi:CheY-like chemotaxis protein